MLTDCKPSPSQRRTIAHQIVFSAIADALEEHAGRWPMLLRSARRAGRTGILKLEFGSSDFAPQGMARVAVAEVETELASFKEQLR